MDILIQVAATGGPILLAVMGAIMAFSPPDPQGSAHWVWLGAFVVVGIIASGANFRELSSSDALQIRLANQQTSLQEAQDTIVKSQGELSSQQKEMNERLTAASAAISQLLVGQKSTLSGATPWLLSPESVQQLISILKPLAPSGIKVDVSCLANDAVGCRYAQQWIDILRSSNWDAGGLGQVIMMPPPIGIFIVVQSVDVPGAAILQHAFSTVGINAPGQLDDKRASNQIYLVIGSRP